MPFVVGTGEAVWRFSLTTDPELMLVTCGFAFPVADPTVADCNDLMDAWADTILTQQTLVYTLVGVTIRFQADPVNQTIFESSSTPAAGLMSGNPVTPNTAVLIQKKTGFIGRRNRGRMYVPGIREADVNDNGDIGTIQLGTWNTHANSLMVRFAAVGSGPIIHHADLGTPTAITSLDVPVKCATQRRRMRP
jgi:hypothetical protein